MHISLFELQSGLSSCWSNMVYIYTSSIYKPRLMVSVHCRCSSELRLKAGSSPGWVQRNLTNENDQLAAKILSKKLGSCQSNTTDSCQPPEVNQTKIEECTISNAGFISKIEECLNDTTTVEAEKACECWESDSLTLLFETLKDCKIKDLETYVKERSKECKTAFTDCKKAQTEFLPLYKQCTTCPMVGVSCFRESPWNIMIQPSSVHECGKSINLIF